MFISLIETPFMDAYMLHKALWTLFPGTPDRTRDHLFRAESNQNGRCVILLQSTTQPTSSSEANVLQSKPFNPEIVAGAQYKFKIEALPTKKDSASKKIVELKSQDQRVEWIQRKLDGANVIVTSMSDRVVKNKKAYSSRYVTFEGILHVNNPDNIRNALLMGIGRKKHAGAGMLSLATNN